MVSRTNPIDVVLLVQRVPLHGLRRKCVIILPFPYNTSPIEFWTFPFEFWTFPIGCWTFPFNFRLFRVRLCWPFLRCYSFHFPIITSRCISWTTMDQMSSVVSFLSLFKVTSDLYDCLRGQKTLEFLTYQSCHLTYGYCGFNTFPKRRKTVSFHLRCLIASDVLSNRFCNMTFGCCGFSQNTCNDTLLTCRPFPKDFNVDSILY